MVGRLLRLGLLGVCLSLVSTAGAFAQEKPAEVVYAQMDLKGAVQ
ncbi:MAG: hypothetical protein NT069_26365 [Planctomycetota bacterium]|nr:hypothetical protein [Planctomycetota bacterium]